MLTIKKVLNSSVVLVVDENGQESILLGKGIGYGRKAGERIEADGENRVFVPVEPGDSQHSKEIFGAASAQVSEVTAEVVAEAGRLLGVAFPPSIYPIIADHLGFAIERASQGVRITNRVFWEIKNFYPDEFRAGELGLSLIRDRLGIQLPEEEAANLAFHFANASSKEDDPDAMRNAKVIGQIINLVLFAINRTVDTKSIHYLRFTTHVKYFVERYFANTMLTGGDGTMFRHLSHDHPRETEVAFKVASHMAQQYGTALPEDEVMYLLVHITRLTSM